MTNSECIIEQYRGGRLVRSFIPTGDQALPWRMCVNGKSYPRTHGWVLSKILPTLMEHSLVTTKVVPMEVPQDADEVMPPCVRPGPAHEIPVAYCTDEPVVGELDQEEGPRGLGPPTPRRRRSA